MKAFVSNLSTLSLLLMYSYFAAFTVLSNECVKLSESNVPSIFYGVPCAAGAMILYCGFGASVRYRWFINILATIILFPVFTTWTPLFFSSTLNGDHPCGTDFNGYLMGISFFERYAPLVHLTTASLTIVLIYGFSIRRPNHTIVGPFYIE